MDERIKRACESVLTSVSASQSVKQAVLNNVLAAIENGQRSENEGKTIRHLLGTEWTWSEFDRCALKFKKTGQWPTMWTMLRLNEEAPIEPTSVSDAIDRLTVTELKGWLKTYAPDLTPKPTLREEFVQACRTHLAWEQIREAALARYREVLAGFRNHREEARCQLLAHTIMNTFHTHRTILQAKNADVTRFEVMDVDDDPVESAFVKRFNRGELKNQLPPFFPGDRSSLLACVNTSKDGHTITMQQPSSWWVKEAPRWLKIVFFIVMGFILLLIFRSV
jgi:hypothetical protein